MLGSTRRESFLQRRGGWERPGFLGIILAEPGICAHARAACVRERVPGAGLGWAITLSLCSRSGVVVVGCAGGHRAAPLAAGLSFSWLACGDGSPVAIDGLAPLDLDLFET